MECGLMVITFKCTERHARLQRKRNWWHTLVYYLAQHGKCGTLYYVLEGDGDTPLFYVECFALFLKKKNNLLTNVRIVCHITKLQGFPLCRLQGSIKKASYCSSGCPILMTLSCWMSQGKKHFYSWAFFSDFKYGSASLELEEPWFIAETAE